MPTAAAAAAKARRVRVPAHTFSGLRGSNQLASPSAPAACSRPDRARALTGVSACRAVLRCAVCRAGGRQAGSAWARKTTGGARNKRSAARHRWHSSCSCSWPLAPPTLPIAPAGAPVPTCCESLGLRGDCCCCCCCLGLLCWTGGSAAKRTDPAAFSAAGSGEREGLLMGWASTCWAPSCQAQYTLFQVASNQTDCGCQRLGSLPTPPVLAHLLSRRCRRAA